MLECSTRINGFGLPLKTWFSIMGPLVTNVIVSWFQSVVILWGKHLDENTSSSDIWRHQRGQFRWGVMVFIVTYSRGLKCKIKLVRLWLWLWLCHWINTGLSCLILYLNKGNACLPSVYSEVNVVKVCEFLLLSHYFSTIRLANCELNTEICTVWGPSS